MEPVWITIDDCIFAHDASLTHFGGADGVRDMSLLESALGRPRQMFFYEQSGIFALASSYAYGVIKNHPFIDGNKRTGFIVPRV